MESPIHPLHWFTYLKLLISYLQVSLLHTELAKRECTQKLSKYLPRWSSMVIHSSFVRNMWISALPRVSSHPFTYPHVWTLLISNSLLSMMEALLALVIKLSLTYPHVPDNARINNHQASYLVCIWLIFDFLFNLKIILEVDLQYLYIYFETQKYFWSRLFKLMYLSLNSEVYLKQVFNVDVFILKLWSILKVDFLNLWIYAQTQKYIWSRFPE